MTADDSRWQMKIDALLCRWPGQAEAVGSEAVQRADRAAFALNQPAAHAAPPDWSAATVAHPLTGDTPAMTGMGATEWMAAAQYVQLRVEEIKQHHSGRPKTQFLALWRLLAEPPVGGAVPDAARRWWRLFPADPRTPAVLLWEHQNLVAALAGTSGPDGTLRPALLQFNIADTQPFVTRARRTQDLWAGSYLLSFLCWQLLKHFADTYGPDCVLQPLLRGQPLADLWLREEVGLSEVPHPGAGSGRAAEGGEDRLLISNIPNIFTVLLPEDQVETAVARASEVMLRKWACISGSVRETFHRAAGCLDTGPRWDGCEAIWERQQNGFLKDNLFWAALPLPCGPLTPEALDEWRARKDAVQGPPEGEGLGPIRQEITANPEEVTGGLLYGLCSQLTARLLNDRKRARDFEQVNEPGQKCSLSGALQAVYPTPLTAGGDLAAARDWWQRLAGFDGKNFAGGSRIKMAGRIRRGDRLCAIQATKRLMLQSYFEDRHTGEPQLDRHQFPSTAGIANARFVAHILGRAAQESDIRTAVGNYVRDVRGLLGEYHYESAQLPIWREVAGAGREFSGIDAECLYEEFYEEAGLRQEFPGIALLPDFEGWLRKARDARAALLQALKAHDAMNQPPLPARGPVRYYAIIAMDGDSMGDWISGKNTPGRPAGPALHLALTGALSGFALEDARRIVEVTHAGKLVYAGGDDVLALVPVADLLPVMDALYRAFRGLEPDGNGMPGFVERGGVLGLRMGRATLSAGAVIVHEATPLSYAMEQAREAERNAKERHGRDAFAIRLLKRSGAPVEVGAKWRAGGVDVPQAVLAAARLMRDGKLSSKIAYTMEADRLEAAGVWPREALAQAQAAEFRRLARRHITAPPGERAAVAEALAPLEALVALADPPRARHSDDPRVPRTVGWESGWSGVQGLLRLARMIGEEA